MTKLKYKGCIVSRKEVRIYSQSPESSKAFRADIDKLMQQRECSFNGLLNCLLNEAIEKMQEEKGYKGE